MYLHSSETYELRSQLISVSHNFILPKFNYVRVHAIIKRVVISVICGTLNYERPKLNLK